MIFGKVQKDSMVQERHFSQYFVLLAVSTKCRPPRCQNKYFCLRLGGLFNSFSFKSSIFTSCMKEFTITHFCAIVDSMNQKQFHLEWLHLLRFLFLLPLYFVHHKHFSMPLHFQQTCTFLVGPCGKPLLSVCTERIPAAPYFLEVSRHLHYIKQSGYPKLFEVT